MKKKLSILTAVVMIMTLFMVPAFAEDNLIVNGDFEGGNTGFTSEYTYHDSTDINTNGLWDPFMYTVGTNPSLYHERWSSFCDHTIDGDKMMIVNAEDDVTTEKEIWSQEVDLEPCEAVSDFTLYAGQFWEIGKVLVKTEEGKVCVKLVLIDEEAIDEGWLITEVHAAVGATPYDIPQKNGNPIPGQFPINEKIDPGVLETEWFCLDYDWKIGVPLRIAAHAVVAQSECIINAEAPYGGSRVVEAFQGLKYDYTAVKAERSVPENALVYEIGHSENYFYSLGFMEDREGYPETSWIVIEFDNPITNGEGNDLTIIEDTWGLPYPVEMAEVFVSNDGVNWLSLGFADNQTPINAYHTETQFDLPVGMEYATYVKVKDMSVRSDFDAKYPAQAATLDGFDLNVVLALHNNVTCDEDSETAWGGDEEFNGRNWARYIEYTPYECSNDYELSMWFANSYPIGPALLEIFINDISIGTADLNQISNLIIGQWKQYKFNWDGTGEETAKITIKDKTSQYTGYDFCIDDIVFVKK
ncbi:MAG: hypothetical protein SCJ93_09325 [Bacillota bacterium]|nr:hypothetical protein [Bacillota bacterium]